MKDIVRPETGQPPNKNTMTKIKITKSVLRDTQRHQKADDDNGSDYVIDGRISQKNGVDYGEEGLKVDVEMPSSKPSSKRNYKDICVYLLMTAALIAGNIWSGKHFIPNDKKGIFIMILMGSIICFLGLLNVLLHAEVINCPCGRGCFKKCKE